MHVVLVTALLACVSSFAYGGDSENPFRKAKVGDWAEYKMTGANVAGTTKMTILTADDKEVTYEVTATFSAFGQTTAAPVQKIKVDLTKSYDPIVAANLAQNNVKVEKTDEGSEKIKAAGKELDTRWTRFKTTTTVNDTPIISEYRVWFSKDVPVSGLVKMESTTMGTATTVELVGSGGK